MRLLLLLIVALAGLASGGALTFLAVAGPTAFPHALTGGWLFLPRQGAPEIDPYARARMFYEGELPLAAGEGFALRARADSDGKTLSSRCEYRLWAPFPTARYWTVTLVDGAGRLVPNLAERHGFTSAEIIRPAEGPFTIEIGPEPLPGNWLPTGRPEQDIQIIIRLYETPLAATATQLDPRTIPRLSRIRCP
ncbi:DUF1214 domain-containing protein [Rhabdaerophilum sp. SD176]|uniref:DUF1214 domain-containing protein n=1 Tax=Rhabdaerophilum sp. SD176 TaxID=2983548 RepID=UPI0024DFA8A6|nr:DUF1214 domain-containing protein [Rhabdaerophilum sp. SD176]